MWVTGELDENGAVQRRGWEDAAALANPRMVG